MGIVFKRKEKKNKHNNNKVIGQSYKCETLCQKKISQKQGSKAITHQSIQFLKSLGLNPRQQHQKK